MSHEGRAGIRIPGFSSFTQCSFLNMAIFIDRKGMRKTDASDISWFACEVTIYRGHCPSSDSNGLLWEGRYTRRGMTWPTSYYNWSLPGELSVGPFRGQCHQPSLISDSGSVMLILPATHLCGALVRPLTLSRPQSPQLQ